MSRLIYLDNAATTKVAPEVVEAMLPYFTENFGNPSSVYSFASKNKDAITKQREDKILLNIVELTSDYTALYLEYKNTEYAEGGWYNISKDAYVRDKATGKKYRCIATENCAFAPYQTPIELNETKIFILYFEALPESANKIDFIESTTSDWQFYDIILKQQFPILVAVR